jgi:hypothetical protein
MDQMQSFDHTPQNSAPRHARLFDLLHQQNLAAQPRHNALAANDAGEDSTAFRKVSHRSLLPQEREALGISASFGR